MKNNKGFTLTEILLAVMIVGIIGIALAALTTAALRESEVGRVRLMLRNQISLFLRQLRQDIREAESITVSAGGTGFDLAKRSLGPIMPAQNLVTVQYSCGGGLCLRDGVSVLSHVQSSSVTDWQKPFVIITDGGKDSVNAVLRVRIVVGVDSEPAIKEAIEETILLPHGLAVKQTQTQ